MPKLVYMASEDNAPVWASRRWSKFVEFEYYSQEKTYAKDTVFMYDVYRSNLSDISIRLAQEHRVIIDNANEHYVHIGNLDLLNLSQRVGQQICWIISGTVPAPSNFKIIATPYWYWIIDQKNFRDGNFEQLIHRPTGRNHWLCTMNLRRHERDYLFQQLKQTSTPGLLSYRDNNILIPDDYQGPQWQRRINPEWLADTYYTIVPESYVQDGNYRSGIAITERNNEFICEKTLKPLAGQHPFMLISTRGNLQHVRDLGFETFPELFDESYDFYFSWTQRIDAVLEQVRQFDPRSISQPRVLEKLKYNQNRFFDQSLTDEFFAKTVAEPVLKWIYETT